MASHDYLAFGDLLRRHRVFAGMSQEELAARAGLSARAISDLERGVKRVPRRDTVQLLVEALQLKSEAQETFVAAAREPAARPRATVPEPSGTPVSVASVAATSPRPPASRGAQPLAPGALPVGGFLGAAPARPLVGREAERADLLGVVEATAAGSGQLVTIAGEPGIGKTRLAQEVMLACRERQFLVSTGRCYEPHRAVPYYPFLEALSALVAAAPEALRAELPARWPSLARLLPEQPVPAPSTPPGASPQEEQQRLFWAVTGFLQALAESAPVAVLLDDLHWADDASLELLQHLARHTRARPILLVGTYRDVEVGRQHPLERALRDLEREHLVWRVSVHRLAPEGTARLIGDLMGQEVSGEFAALVHSHTDGHPLFVQEVLRALIERGDIYRRDGRWERKEITAIAVPETVRATIADRVARLSEPAQEALLEASVLGQAFSFEDLHAIGDQPEESLDAALEEALAAGLAQETGEGYIFNHALTQQALYVELSTRRRRKLHLAAGAALERLPEVTRQRRAAELAWHFREGSAPERALPYALLAGDDADHSTRRVRRSSTTAWPYSSPTSLAIARARRRRSKSSAGCYGFWHASTSAPRRWSARRACIRSWATPRARYRLWDCLGCCTSPRRRSKACGASPSCSIGLASGRSSLPGRWLRSTPRWR
ncbi:MAG TPA: AAA family ATPase [Ktedonobacterales bacterium]